jgi:transposase InsO family protein
LLKLWRSLGEPDELAQECAPDAARSRTDCPVGANRADGEGHRDSRRTVRKWLRRHHKEGLSGLSDRSSRPHRLYRPTPPLITERVGHRITGDRTGQSNSRGVGWEYVDIAIDDASRIAFCQILPNEKKESAVAFLEAVLAYYQSLGVTVSRVMTDNGSCYKSFAFRDLCRARRLKHIRTKAYTPKTNGKAERFIQTALREWAYAQPYPSSNHRADELPAWLHRYNWHRPHGGIKSHTPISRLAIPDDNLLSLHT